MRHFLLSILLLYFSSAWAQVESGEKIILTSADPNERVVTGIAYPSGSYNAANAGSVAFGKLIYSPASGINALNLSLSPAIPQYVQGMVINFTVASTNTGPVTVSVNGLPAVTLHKNGTKPMDSLDIAPGQTVTAIYDGSAFQVISRLNRRCPAGFADVNKDYCIEQIERDTVNWFQATKICGDLDARMCSFSEWAYACTKSATLGLIGMTNNLEWIDSAANNVDQCKTMGMDTGGFAGCNAGVTAVWSYKAKFRCCYSK